MAVQRPQTGPALTGVHIALIAFVAVTVVALVFLVIMYTQQEDVRQRAEAANNAAKSANTRAAEDSEKYKELAKLLTGNPEAEPPAIEQQTKAVRQVLVGLPDLPDNKSFADYPLVIAFQRLAQHYDAKAKQAKSLEDANKENVAERAKLETLVAERSKEFAEKTTSLQNAYDELKKEADEAKATWKTRLEKFDAITDLTQRAERAEGELKKSQAEIERLNKELAKKQERIEGLVSALEKFRPSTDPKAVLQEADGKVLRVLPDESMVYINLGKRDRITPGLTFAVYPTLGGVTKEGRGKATIEVVTVLSDTSECRITSLEAGSAVVAGDLIANPVYDRNRTFNFVVAGDFSLGFGKTIDDPNGVKVKKLIQSWGGRIVDKVDEQTDFVVLGVPPEPVAAINGGAEAQEAAKVRNQEIAKRAQAFAQIKGDAIALGIPVLTRLQFLHFIGHRVPAKAVSFVVVGDFDTNMDGTIDDRGGAKVKDRIREWGGTVVGDARPDEWTDYVVLGRPPEDRLKLETYNEAKERAQALSIPILTATDFEDFFENRVAAGAKPPSLRQGLPGE